MRQTLKNVRENVKELYIEGLWSRSITNNHEKLKAIACHLSAV